MNQQEHAPILTTREEVAIALGETAAQCGEFDATCVRCQAARLLCDLYGFKLEQFFGDEVEAVK